MSSVRLTPPPPRRISWLYLLAGLAVAAALVAVAAAVPRPLRIVVDGRATQVRAGSVVEDIDASAFASRPGDLLALNGSVIETAGGEPMRVYRNGRRVAARRTLYEGDVLTSEAGADVTERAITETRKVPFSTRIVGSGPISQVETPGVEGVRRVTRGERSDIVSSDVVVRAPVEQVVVKVMPKPGAKLVALTFDDGPWRGQTDKVLDILKQHNIHATFFEVGGRIRGNRDLTARAVAEGHLVGNHTLSHRLLTRLTPQQVHLQIQHGAERVGSVQGTKPRWFRPPYGAMDGDAWREARKLRASVVLWTVDSRDWTRPGTGRIVHNVVSAVKPGSIVLMHDGGGDRRQTVSALPRIIEQLQAEGYIFVTVEELAAAR